jgi:biopolymer transport protein ExbB
MDVTLGNARKVDSIQETWWEHVQKGGPIMIPMAVLAGTALLVVLLKWLSMAFVRRPSRRQLTQLLAALEGGDQATAVEIAGAMRGPGGRMLAAGATHLGQPRELIEEVMFEKLLTARLKLQSWLPFVAICATSAPLLGLLGTVTGIMGTFALMTEFGGGDPKVLSSGISEALVTTENGLVIAIPSLLLHAFLSRKAKGLTDGMEKMAVQFMNHMRAPAAAAPADKVEAD